MAQQLTQEQIELIWSIEQLPVRTIAKRAKCSIGAVSKVLNKPRPFPVKVVAAPAPPEAEAGDDAVSLAEQLVAADATNESELRGCLSRLATAGRLAQADKDVARMVSVERVRMQILTQIEKLKPAPVVDPNDQPDMVEAAKRFRERMHSTLDRILQGVSK